MERITLTIDNIKVEVPSNYTVLEAAKEAGIDIPTLCYLKDVNEVGSCRVCLVEIEGARTLQASCVIPVSEGMVVRTNNKNIRRARKDNVELILSNHNRECLTCSRNLNCELQTLSEELEVKDIPFKSNKENQIVDDKSVAIVRDPSKCILCGRCVSTCRDRQNMSILDFTNRGINTEVAPPFGKSMADTPCIHCGQCIVSCPVAALREKEDVEKVWDAIEDKDIHVVVQTAPATRVALGESFGLPIGTRVTGKMVAALRRLGFDKVYDTNFGADLTIMEEGYELLDRIQNNKTLPLITSCCPVWIRYCEYNHQDMIDNLSSCKSPHQIMGATVKSYYAEKKNIDPKKIFVVSIMPCTSKKAEIARPEMEVDGNRDVDAVLTTRELAKMIKQSGIKFLKLDDEQYDQDLVGEYTGAGAIFGVTGGVMEAAIRTVAEVLEDKEIEQIKYESVRGFDGIKESTLVLGGIEIKIAVAHGPVAAEKLLDMVKKGEKDYHFIEIMGCSGGCISGGGQPHVDAKTSMEIDVREARGNGLYEEDESRQYRKSHKNPQIVKLYEDYLSKPNSHKAHKLLHTHYTKREKFPLK